MLFTNTMEMVHETVEADDHGKWDQIVPCRTITMDYGRLTSTQLDRDTGLSLSGYAQGQVCARLGMPAPYFRKCPAPLQDVQFNHWNHQREVGFQLKAADLDPEETWLLRAKGDTLRGVLSPRYTKLDNRQLLEALVPVLHGKNYGVNFVKVGNESFHLRLVDPNVNRAVLRGDELMVGIHLANSEVGLRAVTVDALVFRLVCSNGLIRRINSKSLLKPRHIHVSEPRFQEMLESAIGEAVLIAAGFIEQMAMTLKVPVPDPNLAIECLGSL